MLEAGAACTALGSSKVQAALVGAAPTPALSMGKAHSALICVFLSVNEISCKPCHSLELDKALADI